MIKELEDTFISDVIEGLSDSPKHLSSKYFYDKKGDELFVKITELPEYYLTRAEIEILSQQGHKIIQALGLDKGICEVIELGAGVGQKSALLLKRAAMNPDLTFIPIDISTNSLSIISKRFQKEFPHMKVHPVQGEYMSILNTFDKDKNKVILFFGSNIGNLTEKLAKIFIKSLSEKMTIGDKILLGLDLKKSASIILPAYDDSSGITREFNLNLLDRINRELGADFDLNNYKHHPVYDEEVGEARSYLISLKKQRVYFQSIDRYFQFTKGEEILTEISQKYDDKKLNNILENSGLRINEKYTDRADQFADYLLEKIDMSSS